MSPKKKRIELINPPRIGRGSTDRTPDHNLKSESVKKKSKADMSDSDEGHYSYIESVYGQVQRSFTLPEDVDAGGLSAKYEDGVIKIHIPRIPQQKAQRQRISLQ